MPVAVVFLLRAVVLVLLWGFVVATVVAVRNDIADRRGPRLVPPAPPAPAAKVKPAKVKPVKAPKPSKLPAVTPTKVVVLEGPNAGTTVTLSSLPVTIGRADDASIVLTDDYVSHHHARLIPRGQEWLIEDTGSTNGTFVGDTKLTAPVVVPAGGRIRIGRNILELQA